MGVIKGVLREELDNSIRMKRGYLKAIKDHPGGSLIKKKIRGHEYYYLVFRDGKKVRFIYKGKAPSGEFIAALKNENELRNKYKELVARLDKRARYIRRVLRGKEDV